MRHAVRSVLTLFAALASCPDARAGAGIADVASEDPGLLLAMGAMLTGFVLVCILAAVLFLVTALVLGVLWLAGALSLSVGVLWYRRSMTAGLRTFLYSVFAGAGMLAGAFGGFLLHAVGGGGPSSCGAILLAALAGGMAGLLLVKMSLATLNWLLIKYR